VHPPAPERSQPRYIRLLQTWRARFGDRFLLENTKLADFDAVREELPELPVCMDTGHLLLENREPFLFAGSNAPKIRQIHLHGLSGGRDHGAFLPGDKWYRELLPFLKTFSGILELEIFDWERLAPLISALKDELIM